jgi:hypothetical protein
MKTIEIKTEPAGYVAFGRLSDEQTVLLSECLETHEICDDLLEIRYNFGGDLNECEGVFISGSPGDPGNEGIIVIDDCIPAIGPPVNSQSIFEDGVYVINMQLSKCSFGFEFEPEGTYDPKLFEEVCVPVNVPAEIVHDSYGHPDYNVVIGYRYNGEDIEESLEGELIDRGFDPQLIFFVIKDGVTAIAYSNHNGDEEWGDKEVIGGLLKSFL